MILFKKELVIIAFIIISILNVKGQSTFIFDEFEMLNIVDSREENNCKNRDDTIDSLELVFFNSFYDTVIVEINNIFFDSQFVKTDIHTGKSNCKFILPFTEIEEEVRLIFINRKRYAEFRIDRNYKFLEIYITDRGNLYLYYKNSLTMVH